MSDDVPRRHFGPQQTHYYYPSPKDLPDFVFAVLDIAHSEGFESEAERTEAWIRELMEKANG